MKSMSNAKSKIPHALDGIEREVDNAERWRREFSSRFTCVEASTYQLHSERTRRTVPPVTTEEPAFHVGKLSSDKSPGMDGTPAEYSKLPNPCY